LEEAEHALRARVRAALQQWLAGDGAEGGAVHALDGDAHCQAAAALRVLAAAAPALRDAGSVAAFRAPLTALATGGSVAQAKLAAACLLALQPGAAGAVIAGGKGTAADKFRALEAAGVRTVKSPAELGTAIDEQLRKRRKA
jgi:succinyl-CoA synthetase alpha subunit